MHKGVHMEMAYQLLTDHPNPKLLEFLLAGVARPEWRKSESTKIRWVKEWMDMPDNKKHSSKMSNDHSYKLERNGSRFKIKFTGNRADLATVIARLKYDSRDVRELQVEEEPRTCALELAKSMHWVVDFSTPPHTVAAWTDSLHSRVEKDFDRMWPAFYDRNKVKFGRKNGIKDIYRWAKRFVEDKYERNYRLFEIYRDGSSMSSGEGRKIGREVIMDLAQNMADYLAYSEKRLRLQKLLDQLNANE